MVISRFLRKLPHSSLFLLCILLVVTLDPHFVLFILYRLWVRIASNNVIPNGGRFYVYIINFQIQHSIVIFPSDRSFPEFPSMLNIWKKKRVLCESGTIEIILCLESQYFKSINKINILMKMNVLLLLEEIRNMALMFLFFCLQVMRSFV